MTGIEASLLADGRRLHLHHGPIDLIIEAFGDGRQGAYQCAVRRFDGLLRRLVEELPELRRPARRDSAFNDPVAKRMQRAVIPYLPQFITPMAAVAGAVADDILEAMCDYDGHDGIDKIYVNNGGDAAFFLAPGQKIAAATAGNGRIVVDGKDSCRGLATSGWRGRSHSLGIADCVSVLAATAAAADAAATLIANAVDLPGHPSIKRVPARHITADSDLGERPVTDRVDRLSPNEIGRALDSGEDYARALVARKMIAGAVLTLQNHVRQVGPPALLTPPTGDATDA